MIAAGRAARPQRGGVFELGRQHPDGTNQMPYATRTGMMMHR
jgi:hypothetical protein